MGDEGAMVALVMYAWGDEGAMVALVRYTWGDEGAMVAMVMYTWRDEEARTCFSVFPHHSTASLVHRDQILRVGDTI